jgi:hypothetical protein
LAVVSLLELTQTFGDCGAVRGTPSSPPHWKKRENVTSIWKRKREFLSNNDADDLLFIMERYVRRRGEKKAQGGHARTAH